MNQKSVDYIKSLREQKIPDNVIRKEIRAIFNVKKTRGNAIFNKIFNSPSPALVKAFKQYEELVQGAKECSNLANKAIQDVQQQQAKATYQGELGVAESVDHNIKTLDELLKVCQVDLEVWEVEKYIVNKWATARSNKAPNITWDEGKMTGAVKDDGGMSVTPLFQVKAWLKRKTEQLNARAILEEFINRAKQNAPIAETFEVAKPNPHHGLLEISVPDLHLAKLCWGRETGGRDYDINIAASDYKEAVASLFARARGKIGRVLLPVGNDIFNSDNIAGTTTKGTPQANSEDSRWPKTFMTGCQILVDAVTTLAKEVPVDIVIVAGNHDKERCFYLGEYLKAWFRNHSGVTVNNEPKPRKYYRWGNTLIGFTHGSEEKPDKLPGLMANEEKQLWAETKFRQFHLGHLHHEITRDIQGVVIRFLTSLCPPDEWHSSKGYIGSVQSAEAFQYDLENGLEAVYYHNV